MTWLLIVNGELAKNWPSGRRLLKLIMAKIDVSGMLLWKLGVMTCSYGVRVFIPADFTCGKLNFVAGKKNAPVNDGNRRISSYP
ncbi:hypothetical protein [Kaarinaea lacus]